MHEREEVAVICVSQYVIHQHFTLVRMNSDELKKWIGDLILLYGIVCI